MKFGITFFATDLSLPPVEMGRAVENLGFESLWLVEHSHIPVSRSSPWGGMRNASALPEEYWRTHDTFVSFGAIAAVTSRIMLGTGITLLAQRDAVWTAKEVATLDVISGGRVLFGVGYGWNREEMASHGTDYSTRRDLLREKIMVMKSLWTDEVASYEGELISLKPSWAWPKPIQKPHPPIILGAGAGPKTIAHIAEFCDGWIPVDLHDLDGKVEEVREAVAATGRDAAEFEISFSGAKPTTEFIDHLAGLGVGRTLFTIESGPPEEVMEQLGHLAEVAASYGT